MDLNAAAAENIKRIRKQQKLSLERTAALSGVSRSMLGQIERGEANPSVAILGRLAAALKVPAEAFLRNDSFEPLRLSRELDNRPVRLDGGKVILRASMPYDEATRLASGFVDVYISGRYRPEPDIPGCVCIAAMISGTGWIAVGGETYELQERDTLRFASDQPWELFNQGSSVSRALLVRQYRKTAAAPDAGQAAGASAEG
ncbi:MAG: XRE family transcriptional regulator [Oscillibacter sp.]|jgi:transcriptional regulator with XRE-family HTH domain|nr:XRE family transcriptional regulator [Oscillibacter sp.]